MGTTGQDIADHAVTSSITSRTCSTWKVSNRGLETSQHYARSWRNDAAASALGVLVMPQAGGRTGTCI